MYMGSECCPYHNIVGTMTRRRRVHEVLLQELHQHTLVVPHGAEHNRRRAQYDASVLREQLQEPAALLPSSAEDAIAQHRWSQPAEARLPGIFVRLAGAM